MILNVLYQSDNNYILASAASITSLLINNTHLHKINIYYVGLGISEDNLNKLLDLINSFENATLFFIDSQERNYDSIFKDLEGARPWNNRYITWYKLLAFSDIDFPTDRVLYLNPHTIITGKLDDLLKMDFKKNIFYLSYDCLMIDHKKQIGLPLNYGYYNCGVMLVNVLFWKQESLSEYCMKKLKVDKNYVIVDQDFINLNFKERIGLLGPEYNFSSAYYAYPLKKLLKINGLNSENYYSYDRLMQEYYSPKIIHSSFGLTGKPWEENSEHPNRQIWNKYINLSPWKYDKRIKAKKSIAWFIYKYFPKNIMMLLYKVAVRRKFGVKKNG